MREEKTPPGLLEAAFCETDSGVMLVDVTHSHHSVVMLNPAFSRLTGYGMDEIKGRTPGFLFGPETEIDAVSKVRAAISAGNPLCFNLLCYRKDGAAFWADARLSPVRAHGDRVTHYVWILADITERKEAEFKQWESEQRYRSLFEHSSDAVFSVDAEGKVLSANPAAERMTGLGRESLEGQAIISLMGGHNRDVAWRLLRKVLAGERLSDELEMRNQSGQALSLEFQAIPVWGREQVAGAFIIARDITERRLYEKVLKENNESLLRASIELERQKFALDQHAIVSAADATGNIIYVNDKFCEASQYTREELLGQNHRLLNSGHHSPKFFRKMWETISSGQVWHGVVRDRRKDGTFFWVESTIVPFLDSQGRPYRYLSARTDITERIEAEERLHVGRESERALGRIMALAISSDPLEEILDKALDVLLSVSWLGTRSRLAMFLAQDSGELRLVTQRNMPGAMLAACERVAPGYCLCGLAAKGRTTVYSGRLDSRHQRRYPGIQEHGHYCVPIVSDSHALGVLVSYLEEGHPHNLDEVNFLEAVARSLSNVIRRKRAEEELFRAMDLAERASRAKSEFLSRMSHELRTPMNAILGFAQLLESDPAEPLSGAQKESVEQILKAGWHLLELINEVLDLSRIEAGKLQLVLEPVAVAEVVEECRDLLVPAAARQGVEVSLAAGPEGLLIHADRMRLKQVLLNLLSNAVKYNHEKGQVDIAIEPRADGRVRVSVRDTGPGIAEEQLGKLFESFNRLGLEDSGVEGTGIGLVITRRLVELMGGGVGVESRLGEGSTFWAEFPVGIENSEMASSGRLSGQAEAATPRTILYVENESANIRLVEQSLAQHGGIDLLVAPDGRTGLELAASRPVDAVLTDISLPDMDGFEVLRQLREAGLAAPVLALSANATPEDVARGHAAGFAAYLTKPLDLQRFHRVLDGLLWPGDKS